MKEIRRWFPLTGFIRSSDMNNAVQKVESELKRIVGHDIGFIKAKEHENMSIGFNDFFSKLIDTLEEIK
jgi:hypothetical protein